MYTDLDRVINEKGRVFEDWLETPAALPWLTELAFVTAVVFVALLVMWKLSSLGAIALRPGHGTGAAFARLLGVVLNMVLVFGWLAVLVGSGVMLVGVMTP